MNYFPENEWESFYKWGGMQVLTFVVVRLFELGCRSLSEQSKQSVLDWLYAIKDAANEPVVQKNTKIF